MSGILNVSEATSLALHAMIYIEAHNDRKVSTKEIANEFNASEAHLAKVLQRLVKSGLVKSIRGPKGGLALNKPGGGITLLRLYEIFEGPLPDNVCLFNKSPCRLKKCMMDEFLKKINRDAVEYMEKTTLSEVAVLYKKGSEGQNET